jgi:hypothetical protein
MAGREKEIQLTIVTNKPSRSNIDKNCLTAKNKYITDNI